MRAGAPPTSDLFPTVVMLFARIVHSAAFVVAAAVTALPLAAQSQEAGIAVGATAPNATLETLDGKPAQLSQWIGKTPVVLEFWASWCGNCQALEPELRRVSQQFGSRVKFVGVAVTANQTRERVKRHLQVRPMPVEMLYDATGAAGDAYDIPATSYIVVINRQGKVVYTGSGGTQTLGAAVQKALQ
jgi:thiol-disulfide isomerase/thioredoxin